MAAKKALAIKDKRPVIHPHRTLSDIEMSIIETTPVPFFTVNSYPIIYIGPTSVPDGNSTREEVEAMFKPDIPLEIVVKPWQKKGNGAFVCLPNLVDLMVAAPAEEDATQLLLALVGKFTVFIGENDGIDAHRTFKNCNSMVFRPNNHLDPVQSSNQPSYISDNDTGLDQLHWVIASRLQLNEKGSVAHCLGREIQRRLDVEGAGEGTSYKPMTMKFMLDECDKYDHGLDFDSTSGFESILGQSTRTVCNAWWNVAKTNRKTVAFNSPDMKPPCIKRVQTDGVLKIAPYDEANPRKVRVDLHDIHQDPFAPLKHQPFYYKQWDSEGKRMKVCEGAYAVVSFGGYNVSYDSSRKQINSRTKITARFSICYLALTSMSNNQSKLTPMHRGPQRKATSKEMDEFMKMANALNNEDDDEAVASPRPAFDVGGEDDHVVDMEVPPPPPGPSRQKRAAHQASGSKNRAKKVDSGFGDFDF
jgi:hypothetical protein